MQAAVDMSLDKVSPVHAHEGMRDPLDPPLSPLEASTVLLEISRRFRKLASDASRIPISQL